MADQEEMSLEGNVAGQHFVVNGPAGLVIIALLMVGILAFGWVVYDVLKESGRQQTLLVTTLTESMTAQNNERRREHDELNNKMGTLICILALGQKESRDQERLSICLQQWRRAVLMVPG